MITLYFSHTIYCIQLNSLHCQWKYTNLISNGMKSRYKWLGLVEGGGESTGDQLTRVQQGTVNCKRASWYRKATEHRFPIAPPRITNHRAYHGTPQISITQPPRLPPSIVFSASHINACLTHTTRISILRITILCIHCTNQYIQWWYFSIVKNHRHSCGTHTVEQSYFYTSISSNELKWTALFGVVVNRKLIHLVFIKYNLQYVATSKSSFKWQYYYSPIIVSRYFEYS